MIDAYFNLAVASGLNGMSLFALAVSLAATSTSSTKATCVSVIGDFSEGILRRLMKGREEGA